MDIGEAVRLRILELCQINHLTVNKLATISGITQSTLNNIVSARNKIMSFCTKFKPDFCALHQTKKFFQIPLAIFRILRYYILVILCQSVSIRALTRKFQNHGGTPT